MIPIIILTLLVFSTWIFIQQSTLRKILGIMSTLLLLALVIGIIGQMSFHWGMKKATTTTQPKEIYSAVSPTAPKQILIAEPIGKNSDNYVMLYKDNEKDTEPSLHFNPDFKPGKQTESIKKKAIYKRDNVDMATVQTTSEYWVWRSHLYRFLFGFGGDDKVLISQHTQVTLPEDTWQVLSREEMQKLQK